jgi:hypothetical protein
MRFVRWGPAGAEKPNALDDMGRIRDLSSNVSDINGANLQATPVVPGILRLGRCDREVELCVISGRRSGQTIRLGIDGLGAQTQRVIASA